MRRFHLKTKREAVDFALRRAAGSTATTEGLLSLEGAGRSRWSRWQVRRIRSPYVGSTTSWAPSMTGTVRWHRDEHYVGIAEVSGLDQRDLR